MYSGHVEAHQLDAHDAGKLARNFGLADAGRPREQIAADRLLRIAQAGARQLDRRRQRLDRLVLAEHHRLEVAIEIAQHLLVAGIDRLDRDPRHLGDHFLDVFHAERLAPLGGHGLSICVAPTSSITSIALSGSLRSWM